MRRELNACVRKPRWAIAIWLVVIAALAASAPQVQHRLTQSTLDIPGTPSTKAMRLYRQRLGDSTSVPILLQGPTTALDREGPGLVRALDAQPHVRLVLLPAWVRLGGRANWWLPRRMQALLPDLAV
jgi:uncharacterized membrane protein YdfJ with MMPL/SSD domain